MTDQTFEMRLTNAPRDKLLRLLSRLIHELTITGRFYASVPPAQGRNGLVRVNEAVHRLSGHLRDLQHPQEPMTESRAAGITEAATPLINSDRLSKLVSAELD